MLLLEIMEGAPDHGSGIGRGVGFPGRVVGDPVDVVGTSVTLGALLPKVFLFVCSGDLSEHRGIIAEDSG